MTAMVPIVEQLAEAGTHSERAEWLFACPYAVLHREHMNIRRILQCSGLLAGVAYLEAVLSLTCARRTVDGRIPHTIQLSVELTAHDLRAAVRAGTEGAQ